MLSFLKRNPAVPIAPVMAVTLGLFLADRSIWLGLATAALIIALIVAVRYQNRRPDERRPAYQPVKVWVSLSAFAFALSVVHIAFFPDRDSLLVLLATSVYLGGLRPALSR